MSYAAERPHYTFREYVRLEEAARLKHEYFDGAIYAMAGGTPEHAAIASNIIAMLTNELRGSGCRVHSADLRVRIQASGLVTYPDVTVICGPFEGDAEDSSTATNPALIVEVLSPSTATYDRGEKLAHYKRIESLRAVVLVAYDSLHLEIHQRGEDGAWTSSTTGPGETGAVTALSCAFIVDEVYRDELGGTLTRP